MGHFFRRKSLAVFMLLSTPLMVGAQEPAAMTEDDDHVTRWNRFTQELYALHTQQLADREVHTKVELGGYAERPGFYKQEVFFDSGTGRRLSTVQWEVAAPDVIHSISVRRHDDKGRVIRDYSSTYLPDYRNAPTQTLAFLHHYPDGVHAFRAFDASGELLDERCEGVFQGESVFILLDIDEIDQARGERYADQKGIMTTAAYQHCFGDMPETADTLLPPR